jgi:hypothetical protein
MEKIKLQNILEPERFWEEELNRASKDGLFGCSFNNLDITQEVASQVSKYKF